MCRALPHSYIINHNLDRIIILQIDSDNMNIQYSTSTYYNIAFKILILLLILFCMHNIILL